MSAILCDGAHQNRMSLENFELETLVLSSMPTMPSEKGVYVTGLHMVGACWDFSKSVLREDLPQERFNRLACVSSFQLVRSSFVLVITRILYVALDTARRENGAGSNRTSYP
jgi:hypothetical protein